MRNHRSFRSVGLVLAFTCGTTFTDLSGGSARVFADDAPKDVELRRELAKAYEAKDYKKALEAAKKLHELHPDDPIDMYNVACMTCLVGDKDKAFDWLERSVQAGFNDADHMSNDYDLKTLWGERRFRKLVQSIRDGEAEKEKSDRKGANKPKIPDKKPVEEHPVPEVPNLSPQEHGRKVQELTTELIRVSSAGERDEALEISLKALAHAKAIAKVAPQPARQALSLTHYNVCCMLSLKKDAERAFKHLDEAVKHQVPGFTIAEQMEGDSDLDPIRKDPRYAEILKRAKKNEAENPQGRPRPRDRIARPSDHDDDAESKPRDAKEKDENSKRPDASSMSAAERSKRSGELIPMLIEASRKGDYKQALEYALEAVELNDSPLNNYNAACMYSLNEQKDKAFEHLFRSFELGQLDGDVVRMLKTDDDLKNLRSDSRWPKAMEKAEAQMAERRALPKDKEVEFAFEVTLPPNHDKSKPVPLLVAMHHYHGSMDRAIERWKDAAAASGAILLTPQGTWEAGEGSGSFQWGADLDVIDRNVMKAINKTMDQYEVDEDRVALAGFSQGAWVAYALALRHPDAFCGIIPVAGHFRPESEAEFAGDRFKSMHLYIMIGEDDNSQLIKANEQAKDRFSRAGASVNMVIFKGVGHGFPPDSEAQLKKAVRFVLDR